MIWFSASCNFTILPNSVGLLALPLRMISVELRPRSIAHMLAPSPRWATTSLPSAQSGATATAYADGTLTIRGEKKNEKEEKKENYYLSEHSHGSFQRSFRLPDSVDVDKVEAAFKNGVLTVTLPKTAEDPGSPEERETDRDQTGLSSFGGILTSGPGSSAGPVEIDHRSRVRLSGAVSGARQPPVDNRARNLRQIGTRSPITDRLDRAIQLVERGDLK
jgi:Hsp20/alpha crystallin family